MAITRTATIATTRGSESLSKSVSLSGEGSIDADVTVPTGGSGTNKEIACAFDKDGLVEFYAVADGELTLETNDGTLPNDTFTLAANKPMHWYSGCGLPNPFSADVTALFATNAGGSAVTLQLRVLTDVTP